MKKTHPAKLAWTLPAAALCACIITVPQVAAAPAPATHSDSFVASTAVATHWRKGGSTTSPFPDVYMAKFDQLADLLVDSGIRHIRDTGSSDDFIKRIQWLADAGVKSIITIHPAAGLRPDPNYWAAGEAYGNTVTPVYNIDDFIRKAGRDTVAFVEMNNELDMASQRIATRWHPGDTATLSDDPASDSYYINYIKAATASAKARLAADPALADIPLIGPSFQTPEVAPVTEANSNYLKAGDLGAHVDYSNVHHYYLGREPETGTIRGIDFALENCAQVQAPGKGVIATEGGAPTVAGASPQVWPPVVQGRYMPRYYLAHFLKGFTVAAAYELVDEGWNVSVDPPAPTTEREQNFGLIQNNLVPKPAYHAVKNMLSVLKDPGPAFAAGTLDYTMTGATDNVCSALFQKRNGDFYLCLWLGISSYNNTTDGAIFNNPPQTVSLALPASIQGARIFTLDDTGAMTAADASIAGGALGVVVTDRVTIVRLSATASGGAASAPAGLRATPAAGQITLKWAPVFEAGSYIIKRAAAADGVDTTVSSGITATEYTDTGLTDGAPVYYTVTAVAPGGESASSAPVSAVPFKSIIDNLDGAPFVTLTGAWTTSVSQPFGNTKFPLDSYGTNYLHDGNASKGGKSAAFTPAIAAAAGGYDVYIRWVAHPNRPNNVLVEITDTAGTHSVTVNQKANSGTWMLLGTYDFAAGAAGAAGGVVIKNDGTAAGTYVVADAVRFVLVKPRPPAGLVATSGGPPLTLSWGAVTGATGYTVRRAPAPGGPWTVLAQNLAATTYNDITAAADTVYYYTVASIGAGAGEGVPGHPVAGASLSPVISSALTKSGAVAESLSYQIVASHSPASYGATGLPSGLNINTATGLISGAPAQSGTFNVELSATNPAGTGTATLVMTIAEELFPPVITSATAAPAYVGEPFLYNITATNEPDAFGASPLPGGLSIDPATGEIAGIPTASGSSQIILSATNSKGADTATLVLTINPVRYAPVISGSAAADGSLGTGLVYQITANHLPSSYTATGLPEGLGINASTGEISGTPAISGKFNVTLTAANAAGSGRAELVITIAGIVEIESVVENTPDLTSPAAGVFDAAGNLYVVDAGAGAIKKIAADDDSVSTFATIANATALAIAGDGTLYVGTSDGGIAKLRADGTPVTPALAAGLGDIGGLAVADDGTVYVSETDTNKLKKIAVDGTVTTLVETGLNSPAGLALNEATGRLYIADAANNALKEVNLATGAVTTVATGLGTPEAVAIDASGLVYIADTGSGAVRAYDPVSRQTATVADNADGGLNGPAGIAINPDGFVYIMDTGNAAVRVILASPAPAIPLANTSAATRATVTFDGTVRASPSATYQWYKDGALIPGATGATFEIVSLRTADAGVYSVIAANEAGRSGDRLTLTVTGNDPPLSDGDFDTGGGAPGGWLAGALGLLLLLRRRIRKKGAL